MILFGILLVQILLSWGWKCILALQPLALPHIKFLIGNGHTTHFWTDPWLPGGRLRDCFGSRAMYDLGFGAYLRVNTFVVNGHWNLPPPTSNALMDSFQSSLMNVSYGLILMMTLFGLLKRRGLSL